LAFSEDGVGIVLEAAEVDLGALEHRLTVENYK